MATPSKVNQDSLVLFFIDFFKATGIMRIWVEGEFLHHALETRLLYRNL